MREKMKTVILTSLVLASLVQSYLLAYSSPKFDAIIPTDYVESELSGSQSELKQLLLPGDIVLHFGKDQHTILYPNMTFYQMILDVVKQRTFDGIRETTELPYTNGQNPSESIGLEIRFTTSLPFSLLQQIMQLKGESLNDNEPIERIWIQTRAGREEVRVFFINSEGDSVYEAAKADLTVRDVERFVGFGTVQTPYKQLWGKIYLPTEPVQMVRYEIGYSKFTSEQLQRSLFPDPFNTRFLRERNGSEIYTDGKRGLQISAKQQWMSFTDPAAPVESKFNELDTALSAVQFVNRHGGWNGNYIISALQPEESAVGNEQMVMFRQYSGGYPGGFPIISREGEIPYGAIRLTLQNGAVTGYERSLIQLDQEASQRHLKDMPGGDELRNMLISYGKFSLVKNIVPAYRLTLNEKANKAILDPVWCVVLTDGTVEALTGKGAV